MAMPMSDVTAVGLPDSTEAAAQQMEAAILRQLLTASGAFKPAGVAGGQLRADMFIETLADAVAKGGGPYKASFAFAYNLMGYAWGQFAADWLEGKSIPKVMSFTPIELNSASAIKKFQSDMKNVTKTWNQKNRYMNFYGNIDYSTRKQYITYAA